MIEIQVKSNLSWCLAGTGIIDAERFYRSSAWYFSGLPTIVASCTSRERFGVAPNGTRPPAPSLVGGLLNFVDRLLNCSRIAGEAGLFSIDHHHARSRERKGSRAVPGAP
jgi:hypothetical protein